MAKGAPGSTPGTSSPPARDACAARFGRWLFDRRPTARHRCRCAGREHCRVTVHQVSSGNALRWMQECTSGAASGTPVAAASLSDSGEWESESRGQSMDLARVHAGKRVMDDEERGSLEVPTLSSVWGCADDGISDDSGGVGAATAAPERLTQHKHGAFVPLPAFAAASGKAEARAPLHRLRQRVIARARQRASARSMRSSHGAGVDRSSCRAAAKPRGGVAKFPRHAAMVRLMMRVHDGHACACAVLMRVFSKLSSLPSLPLCSLAVALRWSSPARALQYGQGERGRSRPAARRARLPHTHTAMTTERCMAARCRDPCHACLPAGPRGPCREGEAGDCRAMQAPHPPHTRGHHPLCRPTSLAPRSAPVAQDLTHAAWMLRRAPNACPAFVLPGAAVPTATSARMPCGAVLCHGPGSPGARAARGRQRPPCGGGLPASACMCCAEPTIPGKPEQGQLDGGQLLRCGPVDPVRKHGRGRCGELRGPGWRLAGAGPAAHVRVGGGCEAACTTWSAR